VLSALALVFLFGVVTVVAAGLAWLVDHVERRRLRRVAAQVRVTDAIHGAVGATVAPIVTWSTRNHWIVRMRLGPRERAAAGRLAGVAREALDRDGEVEVVFTPRATG
jgi:hypothetical protein